MVTIATVLCLPSEYAVTIVTISLVTASSDECAVTVRKKCAYPNVAQFVCEQEGCCYDNTGYINCYYGNQEGKSYKPFLCSHFYLGANTSYFYLTSIQFK